MIHALDETTKTLKVYQEELGGLVEERTKKLQESEEKTLLLLNSTSEAIYDLDLEGNCVFCNSTCLSTLL